MTVYGTRRTSTKKPRRFAQNTQVPVDRSRAELEALLHQHGATHFGVYREPAGWKIVFKVGDRFVRHEIAESKKTRSDADMRRRWRVYVLLTKAKLETIADGDSTFDREFLADTLLAEGQTVYEATKKAIAESYQKGVTPPLMLGPGK